MAYAQVIQRYPEAPQISLLQYRMATAYYRAGVPPTLETGPGRPELLKKAATGYVAFTARFKDDELADDALYWAARSHLLAGEDKAALALVARSLREYPEGDMRTYAKRLADDLKEEHPGLAAKAN